MPIISNPISLNDPGGALIGFNNLLIASTTNDAKKALTVNTYERWEPSGGAVTVKFQMSIAAEVDYIALAGHNLSGETFILQTAETIGGAVIDVESISPLDNKALMVTFETRTIQEVIFTGTLSAAKEIAVVFAGKALQMQRQVYGGHSPQALSQQTEYQSSMSESGQFLGVNIIRKGTRTSFSWQFISPDWYRENFQPFVESVKTKPFFIMWRPDRYSDEVTYSKISENIRPINMGGSSGLIQVSMNVRGHSDI